MRREAEEEEEEDAQREPSPLPVCFNVSTIKPPVGAKNSVEQSLGRDGDGEKDR